MTIVLDAYKTPKKGRVQLHVNRDFTIQVGDEEARKKVNSWLLNEVSYLFGALPPTLVIGEEKIVWRVPAVYSLPQIGQVGTIGSVDVDVQSGAMNISPTLITELQNQASELARHLPPFSDSLTVADEFIPQGVQIHFIPLL